MSLKLLKSTPCSTILRKRLKLSKLLSKSLLEETKFFTILQQQALINNHSSANNFLENLRSFGKICLNLFRFKDCPEKISNNRLYALSGLNKNIITKKFRTNIKYPYF